MLDSFKIQMAKSPSSLHDLLSGRGNLNPSGKAKCSMLDIFVKLTEGVAYEVSDKGKPVERRGRKAMGLSSASDSDRQAAEENKERFFGIIRLA